MKDDNRNNKEDKLEADTAILLPPPMRPILWYAIQGWAYEQKKKREANKTDPTMQHWLPSFIRLLAQPDWLEQFRIWAALGAKYHGAGRELTACIRRSFERPDTACRLIYEIAERVEKRPF